MKIQFTVTLVQGFEVAGDTQFEREDIEVIRQNIMHHVARNVAKLIEVEIPEAPSGSRWVSRIAVRDNNAVGEKCEDLVVLIQRPEKGWK